MKHAPNFNRLAPIYRWMEWLSFGPFLHRTRRVFLGQLTTARHALILGDGDGRFTRDLLYANPTIEIDAVDASPAMLAALLRRAGPNAKRVHPHATDARTFQPPPGVTYDLVVTHFFLDCLTTPEIHKLAQILRPRLTTNAQWVFSDFAIPHGAFGSLIARPLIAFLYRAFAVLTGLQIRHLPNHAEALQAAGLSLAARHTFLDGLLAAELWRADYYYSHVKIDS